MAEQFEDLTEDELTSFMNGMSDKDKSKYNKMSPEQQRIVRQGHKQKLKYNALEAARTAPNKEASAAALANNAIVQDTLKGGTEQNKAGEAVRTGVGSIEGGDAPITERNVKLSDPTPAQEEERTPQESVTPQATTQEAKADPKTRWQMKGIMQAYYDGDIDRSTRNYLLANTVATFARNTGKDLANVAAAYTGGTVDNDRETSIWDARNQEMAKSAIESEKADVTNSREARNAAQQNLQIQAQRLQNMSLADRRVIAERIKAMAAKMPTDTAETGMLMKAASVLTNPQMSWQELAGMQGAEALGGILSSLLGK